MLVEELDDFKMYRKNWDDYPKRGFVSTVPLHVDMELTNACNLNCKMCPYHGPDGSMRRKIKHMDINLYEGIIDEITEKGTKAIKLNYAGESMLYSRLARCIEYAKEKGILDVQLNTNATLLTNEKCLELMEAGLDLLIVTDYDIDGQKTNVSCLHVLKQIYRKKKPKIRVKTTDPMKWMGLCDEISDNVYFDYTTLKEDFTPSDFKCSQPWQRFLVLVNGDVCSCSCGTPFEKKLIGNVQNFSIEQLWNKKQMKFLRMCHESGQTHLLPQCRECPARNEYIKNKVKK